MKKKDSELTLNTCIAAIEKGFPQTTVLKELKISKPTLKAHLTDFNTSWKELIKAQKVKIPLDSHIHQNMKVSKNNMLSFNEKMEISLDLSNSLFKLFRISVFITL